MPYGLKNALTIHERLDEREIKFILMEFEDKYAGQLVKHKKTNNIYRISHFSILNEGGGAFVAVNYHPFDTENNRDLTNVKFTRPAFEFLDGRFHFAQSED